VAIADTDDQIRICVRLGVRLPCRFGNLINDSIKELG
jgi:hypothetical protein